MHLFRWIKRLGTVMLTLAVGTVVVCGSTLSAHAYTFTPSETLHSEAAVLYNRDTGQTLYEKNADQPQTPGQLTQIMTAIVVMEQCSDLNGTTITANDDLYAILYNYDEPDDLRYADIYNGDTLSVQECLYAMMLTSSCESALILADYFGGGDINAFVGQMNSKAQEIGCTATTFTNPTGLADSGQTTTARDMLTITNYALQLSGFEDIATAVSFTPTTPNPANHADAAAWTWTQANSMALETSEYYYVGAKGIKTGNISQSGRSIITEATRDGDTYLAILMTAPFTDEDGKLQFYHLDDATALLNWAFSSFSYVTLLKNDEEIAEVQVDNSDGNAYVLVEPKDNCVLLWCDDVDITAIQKVIHLSEGVQAPVKAGDELGSMELKFSGDVIATVPLVAVSSVDRSFTKFNLYALQNFPHSPWFRNGLVAGCVCTALYILLCVLVAYRTKRNNTPKDPIHLVPHATQTQLRSQQNWKRSETVFYHGPETRNPETKETPEERQHEMAGSHKE